MLFIRIAIPLLILFGILNLIVGVANDAVNFLGSATGSGAAKRRNILFVSAAGLLIGSLISAGMMEFASGDIIYTGEFDLTELLSVFLAATIVNIYLIDTFNTLKLPTSTTIAVVFELTGGALAILLIKRLNAGEDTFIPEIINTNEVFLILTGIVLSIVMSLFLGLIIQFIARLVFTFNYRGRNKIFLSVFGGLAITAIFFMIFKKTITGTFIDVRMVHLLVVEHLPEVLVTIFAGFTFILFFMSLALDIDISRIVVLFGTFALAMSFAANDLVNFIGVPVEGIKKILEQSGGMTVFGAGIFPVVIFLVSALIMSLTIFFSKRSGGVTYTEIALLNQGSGRERFGIFPAALFILEQALKIKHSFMRSMPAGFISFLSRRYESNSAGHLPGKNDTAFFDNIRAIVNLTIAGLLISLGTYFEFPLSTTFVVFMVAIGAAIADNAWKKENAANRIAGVIYIVSGWGITSVAAFLGGFAITVIIFYGKTAGLTAVTLFLFYRLYKTIRSGNIKKEEISEVNRNDFNGKSILSDIEDDIRKIILECSKIYYLSVNSFVEEDRNNSAKAAKDAKHLYGRAEAGRSRMFESLTNTPGSGMMQANILIQTFDHLSEIMKNLEFITQTMKEGYSKKGNRLIKQQKSELHNLSEEVSTFFNFIIYILKEKRFDSIPELISKQQMIISYIEDLRTAQIKRAKNREGSTKGGLLFIDVLADTKNLLLSSVNFLNNYRKYA